MRTYKHGSTSPMDELYYPHARNLLRYGTGRFRDQHPDGQIGRWLPEKNRDLQEQQVSLGYSPFDIATHPRRFEMSLPQITAVDGPTSSSDVAEHSTASTGAHAQCRACFRYIPSRPIPSSVHEKRRFYTRAAPVSHTWA